MCAMKPKPLDELFQGNILSICANSLIHMHDANVCVCMCALWLSVGNIQQFLHHQVPLLCSLTSHLNVYI